MIESLVSKESMVIVHGWHATMYTLGAFSNNPIYFLDGL